jgi:hypothetical protein
MSIACVDKNRDGKITNREFWNYSKQVLNDLAFEQALRRDDPISDFKKFT